MHGQLLGLEVRDHGPALLHGNVSLKGDLPSIRPAR